MATKLCGYDIWEGKRENSSEALFPLLRKNIVLGSSWLKLSSLDSKSYWFF